MPFPLLFQDQILMEAPIKSLWSLYLNLHDLEEALNLLNQAKRRERGAYVSKRLSPLLLNLESSLLKSFHSLFTDLLSSLRGPNNDVISGRFHQAKRHGDIASAGDYFELDDGELDQPIDKSRLAALLTLLALWQRRHTSLLQEAAQKAFDSGRDSAIAAANLPTHQPIPEVEVPSQFLSRYEGDVERLARELEEGTKRVAGVRWAVENSETLGALALHLRELENSERYRVEMMSEHLLWWGESAGTITGAKEATSLQLALLGYSSISELPAALLNKVPRYIWVGPDDARCCSPCLAAFSEGPLFAEDLTPPYERCEFSENCRHSYEPYYE